MGDRDQVITERRDKETDEEDTGMDGYVVGKKKGRRRGGDSRRRKGSSQEEDLVSRAFLRSPY